MKITRALSVSASLAFAGFLAGAGPSAAQTLSGTLSNFDVLNDTGQVSRGFEIELQGLTRLDIAYTFGGSYIRYGDPAVTEIPGGVLIRYASAYDAARGAFLVGTPVPADFSPTTGHQCWTGGSAGYATSGCEHFGVGLLRNPTSVQYRWLVEDSANPGLLKSPGASVSLAAPLWTVTTGAAGGAQLVNAHIEPPKAPARQFGDAVWVRVFEMESTLDADLNHLLTDDPSVPQGPTQMEVEWELLQSNPKKSSNGGLDHSRYLGNGSRSVIRRFEFYKYAGAYDPESHEALCSFRQGKGSDCISPGPGELGDYIGAQMAAAQFGAALSRPKPAIAGVANSASGLGKISAGSWVSIYGSGLSVTTRSWDKSDFQGTALPVSLDGVSAKIDGKPAAIAFVSPGQVNVQAPDTSATGPVAVEITGPAGTATASVLMQPYAPAFFKFQGKYAAAVHTDGAYVAPVGFFGAGVPSRPARPGEVLLIFGSGFGPTSPVTRPGFIAGAAPIADQNALHIRIGDALADILYAGLVGVGEYQFNVVVPPAADGDQTIVADINGFSSVASILIPVKN